MVQGHLWYNSSLDINSSINKSKISYIFDTFCSLIRSEIHDTAAFGSCAPMGEWGGVLCGIFLLLSIQLTKYHKYHRK